MSAAADETESDWRAEWERQLDRCELDVERAESLLSSGVLADAPQWVEPVMRRPMPIDLLPRARYIAKRQAEVAKLLVESMMHTRAQQQLASRSRSYLGRADKPVFLDVSA